MGRLCFKSRVFATFFVIIIFAQSAVAESEKDSRLTPKACFAITAIVGAQLLSACKGAGSLDNASCSPEQIISTAAEVPIVQSVPTNFSRMNRAGVARLGEPVNYSQAEPFNNLLNRLLEAQEFYPEGFLNRMIPDGVFIAFVKNGYERKYPGGEYKHRHTPGKIDLFYKNGAFVKDSSFHHEVGHAVEEQYGGEEFKKRFKNLNDPYFKYKYNQSAIVFGKSKSQDPPLWWKDTSVTPPWEFWEKGFCREYSMSQPNEDFATTVEIPFSPRFAELWPQIQQRAPILKEKILMVVELYHRVDPRFTLEYFLNKPTVKQTMAASQQ